MCYINKLFFTKLFEFNDILGISGVNRSLEVML